MKSDPGTRLIDALAQANQSLHRLVLLVGPSASGKTSLLRELAKNVDCSYLNVNLAFSQHMLEMPKGKRARQAHRIFKDLVLSVMSDTLILDNLEILFDSSLRLDPLRLLQLVSRNQTVVASWNGTLNDRLLTYAEPDHPEYQSYRNVDAITVLAGEQAFNN